MVVQKASNTKQKILLDKQNYETKQTKVTFNCSVRPVRRDQSVLKWNAQVLRSGSDQTGPAHGSKAAEFSRSGRQKCRNSESCDGKNVRACLDPFHLH